MSTSKSSPKTPDPRPALGRVGEEAVAAWYAQRGWREVARNWRGQDGEIDLVVARPGLVAFVEVKTRSGVGFGRPAEAVTVLKQVRLRRLASAFLDATPTADSAVRFDVAEVLSHRDRSITIEIIEGAF